jgi:DNA-binding LacI/PurR family transcriptional regulator
LDYHNAVIAGISELKVWGKVILRAGRPFSNVYPGSNMVTQEQIAEKLGVSRQLVTFALAGYPQVSATSRKRILATAREMGYSPNPHARALRRGRTGIIALWIPNQISSHYAHVARELNLRVKQSQHELIVSEVGGKNSEAVLSHVPVDGIIAVDAPDQAMNFLKSSAPRSVPIISIGVDCCEKTDFVRVDLAAGTARVMAHLIGSGFRRIVHATFMTKDTPQASRRLGYRAAMKEAGLEPQFLYYPLSDNQRSQVGQLIQEYVKKHSCPEAIFCHSDDVAVGIYRGLRDLKLRIPEDVGLVGVDGIQDTEYLDCPLTTLAQPVTKMCETAWQFLELRLARPAEKRQKCVLEPALQIRASTLRTNLVKPAEI